MRKLLFFIIVLSAFLVNNIANICRLWYNYFGDFSMTTVYLIRHCEAEGNVLGIYQGISDSDISDIGKKQLEFLGERFRNIHIDKVYSSPLIRAYKTAEAVAKPKGLKVITDEGLTEISGGVIEGMKFTDIFINYPELEYMWCHEFHNFAPENGEAIRDTYERVWAAVKKIICDNDGKTIVLASHGGALRTLICRLTVGALENINTVGFSDNTAVSKIIFDGIDKWHCEYINDASHVPEEYIPKKNKITTIIEKADLENDNNVG